MKVLNALGVTLPYSLCTCVHQSDFPDDYPADVSRIVVGRSKCPYCSRIRSLMDRLLNNRIESYRIVGGVVQYSLTGVDLVIVPDGDDNGLHVLDDRDNLDNNVPHEIVVTLDNELAHAFYRRLRFAHRTGKFEKVVE